MKGNEMSWELEWIKIEWVEKKAYLKEGLLARVIMQDVDGIFADLI
jgi:hypothetical protein